jgi:hypothetical protein
MPKDNAPELQAIIEATRQHIHDLHALGHAGTATLYAIALLDLQSKLHQISDEELSGFCAALQDRIGLSNVIHLASGTKRKA